MTKAVLLTVLFFALGSLVNAATSDPFVTRLEILFGIHAGGLLPVDTRAPDIRLQYLGTRSVGGGDYDIRVRRVR